MRKILFALMITMISLSPFSNSAKSEEFERYTNVTAIAHHSALRPAEEINIAIQIDMEPHWHVYWKNPGDSGLPVRIDWTLPEGFEAEEIQWPTPDKITYDILVNYGYYDQVTLLQKIKAPDTLAQGTINLDAEINMLVCNEICIPETSKISLKFNDPENLSEDNSADIEQFKTKIPNTIKGQFYFKEENENLILSLTAEDRMLLKDATEDNVEFFPYDWGILNLLSMPKVTLNDGTITITHKRGDQPIDQIQTLKGLLVIKGKKGENKGFEIHATSEKKTAKPAVSVNPQNTITPSSQGTSPSSSTEVKTTLLGALYLALFGGMILNLMPCVFPVLSMKALSLVKMGEKDNNIARLHGLSYTFGVVVSFVIIGGILIVLKEAGSAIGWGFQLQNPVVIAVLAYLLFSIGLNLVGFFEFDFGLGNVGNKLTQGHSISSSFFTGTLATIVATPCTAPFMGVAMGYALTQSALIALSVFAALGFGLALPYLLLSFIPPARKILPRPGAWMNTFKQFLAFPMFASAIWLVWVLDQQSGAMGILITLLGMLAIAFAVWLSHLTAQGLAKVIKRIALALSLILAFYSLSYIKTSAEISTAASDKAYSFGESFTPEKLSILLEGNDAIFVEMTAAWCITCKINHSIALNIPATKKLFKDNNIQYLIGDWTNTDDTITQYLDSFGRNGVPLYVYYAQRDPVTKIRPEPNILPQVLTPHIVKNTIEKQN